MSHQDLGFESEQGKFGEHLCKAVSWLVAPEAFADIKFRKDCTWTPWLLVAAAMLWVWSGEPTLTERFDTARSIVQEAFGGQCQLAGSYQGRRKRVGDDANGDDANGSRDDANGSGRRKRVGSRFSRASATIADALTTQTSLTLGVLYRPLCVVPCSTVYFAIRDARKPLVVCERLPGSQRCRRRTYRPFPDAFDGFPRSSYRCYSCSESSSTISSGVHIIGMGIPKSASRSWIRGKILALAMCLQFHVNRYSMR